MLIILYIVGIWGIIEGITQDIFYYYDYLTNDILYMRWFEDSHSKTFIKYMHMNSELYEFIPFYVEEEINEYKEVNFEDLKNYYFEKMIGKDGVTAQDLEKYWKEFLKELVK